MDHVNIGDAANASGVSAKLIRYYESIDLIPEAARTESGCRVYTEAEVQTLRFIKRARGLGFSIKQVGRLLALWHDRSRTSAQVRSVALAHVEELETKILELRAMANTLRKLATTTNGPIAPFSMISPKPIRRAASATRQRNANRQVAQ